MLLSLSWRSLSDILNGLLETLLSWARSLVELRSCTFFLESLSCGEVSGTSSLGLCEVWWGLGVLSAAPDFLFPCASVTSAGGAWGEKVKSASCSSLNSIIPSSGSGSAAENSRTWSIHLRHLCRKYGLKDPLEYLKYDAPSRSQFKEDILTKIWERSEN